LASIGVQFDDNGKAYAPKIDYPSEVAPQTPAKPKPRTGRDGGPMSPQPKPAAAAPVIEFKTEAEVEAANLPKGTKIKVGGRLAEVQ